MVEHVSNKADDFATVIGPDARFKGELTFQGGVRIDGHFEGSIETDGKVFVSKGGELEAEVKASSLALEGRLVGNLTAKDRVELRATGQMHGDVCAAKLLVVEGATFVGHCEVGPNAKQGGTPVTKGADAGMRPVAAGVGKK
ncbi:MAG: polymer-forming cytoskeletal protein [Planctomycetota bacterium]